MGGDAARSGRRPAPAGGNAPDGAHGLVLGNRRRDSLSRVAGGELHHRHRAAGRRRRHAGVSPMTPPIKPTPLPAIVVDADRDNVALAVSPIAHGRYATPK